MKLTTASSLLVIAVLSGLAMPAHAQFNGTISGDFSGDGTLTPFATPGAYHDALSFDGDDSLFGAFTGNSSATADFTHPPQFFISNGTFTENLANGSLFGTTTGMGTASGHGTATFDSDFVITGGTGLFAGASGNVTVTGLITLSGLTAYSVSATYTGTLTAPLVPEPSVCQLGLSVLFGLGGLGRWRMRRLKA